MRTRRGTPIATNEIATAAPVKAPAREQASMRARAGGYIIDMVIFSAVAMVMTVISGGIFLLMTDGAQEDPSDAQFYFMFGLVGFGVPLAWTALNIALLLLRQQTGGQYVAGVRLALDNGDAPGIGAVAAWWFALNPLLFSWPMAFVSGLALVAVSLASLGNWDLVLSMGYVALCIAAPPLALVAAALDGRHRTLYDRIARTTVTTA